MCFQKKLATSLSGFFGEKKKKKESQEILLFLRLLSFHCFILFDLSREQLLCSRRFLWYLHLARWAVRSDKPDPAEIRARTSLLLYPLRSRQTSQFQPCYVSGLLSSCSESMHDVRLERLGLSDSRTSPKYQVLIIQTTGLSRPCKSVPLKASFRVSYCTFQ